MNDLSENNVVRFISISRKKNGIFAKFRVKGIRGGAEVSSNITVDLAAAEVDLSDPLEKIIEMCAKLAVKESFRQHEMQFEGLPAI